ncbi:MAG: ATP-binding protein [Candidatus Riflebacteria bacterium]|nr:ATP-binding protein [Candidatus Riflebacteria bacterium]
MRTFSSYGPVSTKSNYFVPRTDLLNLTREYLLGKNQEEGGHYITVWASRQCGKTWLLRELARELKKSPLFCAAIISLQQMFDIENPIDIANAILADISEQTERNLPKVCNFIEFQNIFTREHFDKPLILILDEFDALKETAITSLVAVLRNLYIERSRDNKSAFERNIILHGVALIGIRSVLGVENKSGSPFNVQKCLHVPYLTYDEVCEMYHWYEREYGQKIDQDVIDRVFYVTNGQPGLVSWFGELLTERYNEKKTEPIDMKLFNYVYRDALSVLPNNNTINLISKATDPEYKPVILNLFRTNGKTVFEFEDPAFNYLYMHGVISFERDGDFRYAKFPCQFVQEKLFNRFAREIYSVNGKILPDPFIEIDPIINDNEINVRNLMKLYQSYFVENHDYILSQAPRRKDNRIYEATYHFNLYSWLCSFFQTFKEVSINPEFPTGNGKIDLLLKHRKIRIYGLELKSFTNLSELKKSITQAARYGKSLGLSVISLVVFFDTKINDEFRTRFEKDHTDSETGMKVELIMLETF